MLTEKQINNLQPLTNHPKYGPILRDAIKNWQDNVNPGSGDFGIYSNENDVFEAFFPNCQCCLIGAALVGQSDINNGVTDTVLSKYRISYEEFRSLWHGFDLYHKYCCDKEAYEFGEAVRNAIWSN